MESSNAVAFAFVDLTSFALKMFTNWFHGFVENPSEVSDSSQWYFDIHSCSNTVLCNNQHWVALQWQILLSTRLEILRPKCNCRSHSSLGISKFILFIFGILSLHFRSVACVITCFVLCWPHPFYGFFVLLFGFWVNHTKLQMRLCGGSRCNTRRNSHLYLQDFQDIHILPLHINPGMYYSQREWSAQIKVSNIFGKC